MKKIAIALCLVVVSLGLYAGLLWQDSIPIRQGVNIEWFRTGVDTNDGGAIYVWSDTKLGERDLWAQKVDAAGNLVWGEPLLIDGKIDRQEDPVITRTSDNNYIIAWIDFSDDLDGNVYAQKINNAGQLLWPAGGKPICTRPGIQISLNMEADNDGGAFILWVDSRNPSKDIFGQRVSSSGDPLWIVDGIAIASGEGDEVQNTMLPDGQGGMMIGYTHNFNGAEDIYVKRYLSDGTFAWNEPLPLCVETGNQSGVRMAAMNNGEFIFTWQDQRNPDWDIYAQKVNLTGQMLWPAGTTVYSDQNQATPRKQDNPRILKTSDNCAVIVWEDYRSGSTNSDLYVQKMSVDGAKLWAQDGIALSTAAFSQIGARLAADSNGGCFIVWDDYRNGNTPNDDIYAQHLDSNGLALWDADGKAICTAPNGQNGGLVKYSGSNVFINWMDIRNGSVGIYYQVLNNAGVAQLETNGKLVFWGLSGDTPKDNYQILNRSNDIAIIWQDTRFANDGYRIFMQFVNPDGSVDLETNGRPVTIGVDGKQLLPNAIVTPDDHIAIVWEDTRGDNPKVFAQLIDPAGNRLWGDGGMEITNASPLRQKDTFISYHDGSYYIGWSNSVPVGSTNYYHVYGQRIQNGQKMWGADGKVISVLPANAQNSECTLYSVLENYYVWHRVDTTTFLYTIWAKKVDANGDAATGWPNGGLQLSTYDDWDTVQYHPVAARTPEGLFVMWKDKRTDFTLNYWGQHVSDSGTRLWNPLGVSLAENNREQEAADISVNSSGITFTWCENINGIEDIFAHKYSFEGMPLWGSLGYAVVQKDSVQSHPTLSSFSNGHSIIAWADFWGDESDIYYKYITGSGEVLGDPIGMILCNVAKKQYQPLSVILNDEAYVIWADGRSSGKTEILGLYMQKMNSSVSNIDVNIPSLSSLELRQNHPNPFNPSTTISFALKNSTKQAELNIYNLKGQLVKNLHKGSLNSGNHSLVWDGKDNAGNLVSSGVYFYRLSDGVSTQQRKMVMMK